MLIGKKIILRPLKIEDVEKTHQWRNNLELIKMTQGIRFPKTLEMDKEWFEHTLNDKSNRNIYFGIDEIESGEFISIVSLTNIDYISGTAIWGLIIGEAAGRGKGYSVEILNLLLEYSFKTLNLRKIFGYPVVINEATLAMHKKIEGICEEGRLKRHYFWNNEYHDVLILSIFKEDFYFQNHEKKS